MDEDDEDDDMVLFYDPRNMTWKDDGFEKWKLLLRVCNVSFVMQKIIIKRNEF